MAKAKIVENAPVLIDNYIDEQEPNIQAICTKLRALIKSADSNIQEDWKWGPNYNKQGMVCGFGAGQSFVHFAFFKGSLLDDLKGLFTEGLDNKGSRYMKIKRVADMDEQGILDLIRAAVKLNEDGIKLQPQPLEVPDVFKNALVANHLWDQFSALAYTHRKEYIQWIRDAKKEETRDRRLLKAIEMLQTGKTIS